MIRSQQRPARLVAATQPTKRNGMLSTLIQFLVALTYPPMLSACLVVCAAIAWRLRGRTLAIALLVLGMTWSMLWSIPSASEWLRAPLERQHAVVAMSALPKADAIVVLGGGKVRPDQLMNSRLSAAAHAWLAGRARVIILSGGGGRNGTGRGRSEARRMAEAITTLGVPASVLVLEDRSTSTEQNAQFSARIGRQRGIRRILLVTSSLHMPRASLLFREAGFEVIPVPAPEQARQRSWVDRWVPTGRALWRSGRALKEYAGLVAVRIGAEQG